MRDGGRRPLGHHDQVDARRLQRLGLAHDVGQRVVGLAVGEDHEHPVGRVGGGAEELAALGEHAREIRAAFAREVRIERVEVQADGAAVHGERRQDVAPPGERDEAEPVALQVLDQAPRLADGALQPVGRRVLREHRPADVHREDEAQRPRLGADLGAAPARAGEGDGRREPR